VSSVYHWADGLLLTIRQRGPGLYDLRSGEQHNLDGRFLDTYRDLSLGRSVDEESEAVAHLIGHQWIEPGPGRIDGLWRQKLTFVDDLYYRSYAASLSPREHDVRELLVDVHARRKRFLSTAGQCTVLPETALRRSLRVGFAEAAGKKRILCIGDDDLTSVALAALGHEVCVLDVDDYLLELLSSFAAEHNLAIAGHAVDLCQPVDRLGLGRFDVFLTDPSSNAECFALFLSRALALLAPGGVGFVAVNPPAKRLFHDMTAQWELPVHAWHSAHNRYYSYLGKLHPYLSDWVEVRPSTQTRLGLSADAAYTPHDLYSDACPPRGPLGLLHLDQIDNLKYAAPSYLRTLVEVLARQQSESLTGLDTVAQEQWSLVLAWLESGFIALHADRAKAQLAACYYPHEVKTSQEAMRLLISAHKQHAAKANLVTNWGDQDLRVR